MGRKEILIRIRNNKPKLLPLPELDLTKFKMISDLVKDFIISLESTSGKAITVENKIEIVSNIKKIFPKAEQIISEVEGIDLSTLNVEEISNAKEIANLDVAILEGQFGVSENGAVWVSDKNFALRSIPFITSHLVLVLDKNKIVENMHEAMLKLNNFDEGFGVFISGPSKTADIEQSLVIGAQAALSLTVFLI